MAPAVSPLFRAGNNAFDEAAAAEAAADVGKLFEGSKEELQQRWGGSAVVFNDNSLGVIPMESTRPADSSIQVCTDGRLGGRKNYYDVAKFLADVESVYFGALSFIDGTGGARSAWPAGAEGTKKIIVGERESDDKFSHLVNQDRGLCGLVSRSRPGGRRRHHTPYGARGAPHCTASLAPAARARIVGTPGGRPAGGATPVSRDSGSASAPSSLSAPGARRVRPSAFGVTGDVALAMFAIALIGLVSAWNMSLNRGLLQHTVDAHMRGRIMSIDMMFHGLMPLGVFPISWVAEHYGVGTALLVSGIAFAGMIVLSMVLSPAVRAMTRDASAQ